MAQPRARTLYDRVGFYRPATEPDGYGNVQTRFASAPDFSVHAAIDENDGSEAVIAARLTGTKIVHITVRASRDTRSVDESWKARDERAGVDYNIRGRRDPFRASPARGRWIVFTCEQGVAL